MADFPPKKLPDGSVVISAKQVRLHKKTELWSFLLGSPLLIWAATRKRQLNEAERAGLMALGIGALVVDSYLYRRFKKAKRVQRAA